MKLYVFIAFVLLTVSNTVTAHFPFAGNPNVVFIGQSNAERLNNATDIAYFENRYNFYNAGFINMSVEAYGGSAVLDDNASNSNPQNYWVEEESNGSLADGPRLTKAMSDIANVPSLFVWIQGEQDATRVIDIAGKKKYREGLEHIFDRLKTISATDVVFGICITGRRKNSSKEKGIQLIRQAQHELAKSRDDVIILSETYDLELVDHVHYSQNGQEELLDRVADSISSYALGNGFISGPKIKAVNLNSNDKTKLLVEIENVQDLKKGSQSDWLFSAHSGSSRVDVQSTYGISESLLLITLNSPITTAFTLHVGNGKYVDPADISTGGRYQIRNEGLLPIASGIYNIDPARW